MKNNVQLGSLKLEPVPLEQLNKFKHAMQSTTIPKIKEDIKRNGHNVSLARNKIAY